MTEARKDGEESSTSTGNRSIPWDTILGDRVIRHNQQYKATQSQEDEGPNNEQTKYKEESTQSALKNKDFVLLYFSASWCPPCQTFSPILKSFYKLTSDKVEIVYISSDNSVEQFEEYFGKMPWLSLPTRGTSAIKTELARSLKISGIPALIVMTGNGLFVTNNGRSVVTNCVAESEKNPAAASGNVKEVFRKWREDFEAVPINEAKLGSEGPGGIMGFLMALLKNPAAIFAIVYFVKWAMRKHQTLSQHGEDLGKDDIPEEDPGEEPEF